MTLFSINAPCAPPAACSLACRDRTGGQLLRPARHGRCDVLVWGGLSGKVTWSGGRRDECKGAVCLSICLSVYLSVCLSVCVCARWTLDRSGFGLLACTRTIDRSIENGLSSRPRRPRRRVQQSSLLLSPSGGGKHKRKSEAPLPVKREGKSVRREARLAHGICSGCAC
jgi:hypothetical protein